MPKWISVEKAVIKYHIEKEAILLWVEMGQFPMLYIDNVPNVRRMYSGTLSPK